MRSGTFNVASNVSSTFAALRAGFDFPPSHHSSTIASCLQHVEIGDVSTPFASCNNRGIQCIADPALMRNAFSFFLESEFYLQGSSRIVEAIAMSDGQVMILANGQVMGAANGQVMGAANGQVMGAANGQVMGVANGQVMGAANGQVMGAANGQVMGVANGQVMGAANGQVMGAANGQVMGAANGQVMGTANGQVMGAAMNIRWITAATSFAVFPTVRLRSCTWHKIQHRLLPTQVYACLPVVNRIRSRIMFISALNIKLLEPLAQGASRFEKLLAPRKIYWPPFFPDRRLYS